MSDVQASFTAHKWPSVRGDANHSRPNLNEVQFIDSGKYRSFESCYDDIERTLKNARCVIVFGVPDFLQASGAYGFKQTSGFFDFEPIAPANGVAREWIEWAAQESELTSEQKIRLENLYLEVASDRPNYQYMMWLVLLARLVKGDGDLLGLAQPTPLQLFHKGLELDHRVDARRPGDGKAWGQPIYDAMRVLESSQNNKGSFVSLVRDKSPFDAMALICEHLLIRAEAGVFESSDQMLLNEFITILKTDMLDTEGVGVQYAGGHGLYAQGLVADCVLKLTNLSSKFDNQALFFGHLQTVFDEYRARIVKFIDDRQTVSMKAAQLWDLTDTLDMITLPRVEGAITGNDVHGYFKSIGLTKINIGSAKTQEELLEEKLLDSYKPLPPFHRTSVSLSNVYVARYLVTVAEYHEFHKLYSKRSEKSKQRAEQYFEGAGLRWFQKDKKFLQEIERDFELTKARTLRCDTAIEDTNANTLRRIESRTLERAVHKRTDEDRAWLQEPHHKKSRLPVVDVNWWEAVAYCKWYTECKLPNLRLPGKWSAKLLPDWLWEAVRRDTYDAHDDEQISKDCPENFGAHVSRTSQHPGRVGHMCYPVHVGLFPPPTPEGADVNDVIYDLAGNVWEWTDSSSFAMVCPSGLRSKFRSFVPGWAAHVLPSGAGNVGSFWLHPEKERVPQHPSRESHGHPLRMRVLRGGSFMSDMAWYAWGSCLRTCDPPYYSFQDVGFRIMLSRQK